MELLAEERGVDDGRLVSEAVINAGLALGLSKKQIGEIIGVSSAQVSRMEGGGVAVRDKAMDLSLYLIRVFRSLDAITGGDQAAARAWIRNENLALRDIPSELMKSPAGLVAVMNYLDAARAPI